MALFTFSCTQSSCRAGTILGHMGHSPAIHDSVFDQSTSSKVRLACGRIVAGAEAILQAHSFGVLEGAHRRPWTLSYHAEAVHVYSVSLPLPYQRNVMELFGHVANAMDEPLIPGRLAEDWAIVTRYLRSACESIQMLIESHSAELRDQPAPPLEGDVHPPTVIHYDDLARLTTRDGAQRLRQAACAVMHHVDTVSLPVLDDLEMRLLKRVSDGVRIADVGRELGYSQRSIYRALSRLWDKLGVPSREEGLRKAAEAGLLD